MNSGKRQSMAINKSMQGNRAKDTGPEKRLAKVLWANGFHGYRKNFKSVLGRPDFFFRRFNLALFVNGCFWHRCPKCDLPLPKSNSQFWMEKFERNVKRDARIRRQLRKDGFCVVTVWECEIGPKDRIILNRIKKAIERDGKVSVKSKSKTKP